MPAAYSQDHLTAGQNIQRGEDNPSNNGGGKRIAAFEAGCLREDVAGDQLRHVSRLCSYPGAIFSWKLPPNAGGF